MCSLFNSQIFTEDPKYSTNKVTPMLIIAVSFLTYIIFVHNATNFDWC